MATSRYAGAGGGSDMLGLIDVKPQGYKDPSYYAPTLDSRDFMGAKAAQLGQAPQGRGMVQRADAAQISPLAGYFGKVAQENLMRRLQEQASGQGPSAGAAMFQRGADEATANAMATRASGLPGQFAAHQAQQVGAQQSQQAGQQAAQMRAQEQLNAQQGIASLAGQMRDSDMQAAMRQADLEQQARLFNAGAYNQQLGADMGLGGQYGLTQGQFGQQANMQNALGRAQWAQGNAANNMWAQAQMGAADDAWNEYLRKIQMAKMGQADALEKGAFKTALSLGTGGAGALAGGVM